MLYAQRRITRSPYTPRTLGPRRFPAAASPHDAQALLSFLQIVIPAVGCQQTAAIAGAREMLTTDGETSRRPDGRGGGGAGGGAAEGIERNHQDQPTTGE